MALCTYVKKYFMSGWAIKFFQNRDFLEEFATKKFATNKHILL